MQAVKILPQSAPTPKQQVSHLSVVVPGNYFPMAESFKRRLRAQGFSHKTLLTYAEAIQQLGEYLASAGRPLDVASITTNDITEFENLLRDKGYKPSTVNNRHRGLSAYFKWLLSEQEIAANPMANLKPPELKDVRQLRVITDEQWQRLFKACAGNDFRSRRDMAILRLFLATPARLSEIGALRVTDLDLDHRVIEVLGKGGKRRTMEIGVKPVEALDRYLRIRATHRLAHLPELWLGARYPMTASGVYQMFKDRAAAAGMPDLHPHEARATYAADWIAKGGSTLSLKKHAGWSSDAMIARYTALAASQIASDEYKRIMPGDRV